MNKKITLFLFGILMVLSADAQNSILKPKYLNYEIDSSTRVLVLSKLESLFAQINSNNLDTLLIGRDETDFNTLKSFYKMEDNQKDSVPNFYQKQLINFYPIATNEFWLSIAFIGQKQNEAPILRCIINLIAIKKGNNVIFNLPTKHLTKTWKTTTVGNVTYHYRTKINKKRAKLFDTKNTIIAEKLEQKPEKFDFYMCDNYQEVLQLLGFEYDKEENGKTRDGYGVDGNKIFAIRNNEDFSHDVFHYYSDKFRKPILSNSTVEEGVAYSWGNAYYTNKSNGEMIEQKELVQGLKKYLQDNPNINLLDLFTKNTKIFNNLANEISVKSTISSLICDEIERKKGIEGIKSLIKCGRGMDNFFKATNDLILLNKENFDVEVRKLIEQRK